MPSVTLKILGAVLHATILVYGAVVFLLARQGGWALSWDIRPGNEIILCALTAVAFVNGGIAIYAPRFFKDAKASPGGIPDPTEEPLFFDFSPPAVTPRVQTMTIARMAFAESVAIFGLVLSFLNQSAAVLAPYAAVGLLLQIAVGPFGGFLVRR